MGNVSKRQQHNQRAINSQRPLMGLQNSEKILGYIWTHSKKIRLRNQNIVQISVYQ